MPLLGCSSAANELFGALMPCKRTLAALAMPLFLLPGLMLADDASWKRVASTEGIQVFARDVEGSDVREVKAIARIDAPPGRILAALDDIDSYTETMPYTEVARVVKREGNSTWMYTVINAPIVSRRDYCIKLTASRLPDGTLKYEWEPANEYAPSESVGVRVEVTRGHWLLRPVDGGKATQAEYYVYTDPGGGLPRWVINRANNTAVPDVVKAVRAAAKSDRYAKVSHPLTGSVSDTEADN